jgi:Mg2+ and Co2+ transporter CorA
MSAKYLMNMETIKTCGKGALGAMTFGAYHMYVTNEMMKQNNEMIQMKTKETLKELTIKIDRLYQENKELKEQINRHWF